VIAKTDNVKNFSKEALQIFHGLRLPCGKPAASHVKLTAPMVLSGCHWHDLQRAGGGSCHGAACLLGDWSWSNSFTSYDLDAWPEKGFLI